MVLITATAQAQLEALEQHYASLNRDRAVIRMAQALAVAADRIAAQTGPFFPAPRPYPDLASFGWRWLKEGRYWIGFTAIAEGHAVMAVFFDGADIPRRIADQSKDVLF